MGKSNVVELYKKEVADKINEFLEFRKYKSVNTAKAYKHDIEVFYNKPIEYITENDLNDTDLQQFKNFIKDNKNKVSNATIRRRLSAVKHMLKFLAVPNKKGEIPIVKDIGFLEGISELVEQLPINDNQHGKMSAEEVYQIAIWAGKNEKKNADIKEYLIKFALETGTRIGACLSLLWTDVKEIEDGEVLIHYIGKGNKDTYIRITEEFYNEILCLKYKYKNEHIFPISVRSAERVIDNYREAYNIPKERKIVFHSIRGAAARFAFKLYGNNIQAAQKKLNHRSSDTTEKYYLRDKDIHADGMISMKNKVDQDLYKKVDDKMRLQALEEMAGDFKLALNLKLQEMLRHEN